MTAASPEAAPLPEIDAPQVVEVIVGFIRSQLQQTGFERLVVGLSGGVDSATVAYLAARAVGPENLLAVRMPYRTSDPSSETDALTVIAALGCDAQRVDLTPMADPILALVGDGAETATRVRRGNVLARLRMIVLYDRSAAFDALVCGTSNKTEALLGYGTLHGDMAAAIQPIGDLYKSQLRAVATELGVPTEIVAKPPSADLWPGQTDEDELGATYDALDRILFAVVDRRWTETRCVRAGMDGDLVRWVVERVARNEFKRQMPPAAKVSLRTPGIDHLYPRRRPRLEAHILPANRLIGPMAGRLVVVGTPIGNLGDLSPRAAEALREADLVVAEDTRVAAKLLRFIGARRPTQSFTEHNAADRMPGLLDRLAAGDTLALTTDAGMPAVSDPGADLVAAARAAGHEVTVVPGPSAVTTALAAAGVSGPAGSGFLFGGFLPARPVSARRVALERLVAAAASVGLPLVLFEAPHRMARLLGELDNLVGQHPDLRVSAGRELTKLHEEIVVGNPAEVAAALPAPRGEFTLVVSGLASPGGAASGVDGRTLAAAAQAAGLADRSVVEILRAAGIGRREAYALAQAPRARKASPT